MSSINSVRNLQMLYFSRKNIETQNLKMAKKKWVRTTIYTYYSDNLIYYTTHAFYKVGKFELLLYEFNPF